MTNRLNRARAARNAQIAQAHGKFDVPKATQLKVINFVLESKYPIFKDKIKHHDYIAIADFSQPSYKKRFYVYSLESKIVVRTHHVTHGKNSASKKNKALVTQFSNQINSHMSSRGALTTAETYIGKYGYSLRLDGLEPGINDNVRKRAIVIHPAHYATNNYIIRNGRTGLSYGCLALDPAISTQVIDLIKEGRFIYIYF